jgi:hypothetical protein
MDQVTTKIGDYNTRYSKGQSDVTDMIQILGDFKAAEKVIEQAGQVGSRLC